MSAAHHLDPEAAAEQAEHAAIHRRKRRRTTRLWLGAAAALALAFALGVYAGVALGWSPGDPLPGDEESPRAGVAGSVERILGEMLEDERAEHSRGP